MRSPNMHELSICSALMDQLQTIARERNAKSVSSVVVRIGPLAGVEPQLLRQAYLLASAGTLAEGSELRIELSPVRVRCAQCGAESPVEPNRLICPACGDWRTEVLEGEDLLLASVELQRSSQAPITA
jgi:hydrogenase nickel incorporation protein HypA/HybF